MIKELFIQIQEIVHPKRTIHASFCFKSDGFLEEFPDHSLQYHESAKPAKMT